MYLDLYKIDGTINNDTEPCFHNPDTYPRFQEELEEFRQALDNNDLLEAADALTDILYVTYGAGHAFGIDSDACFQEVQNSNMSKLGEDGRPIFNDKGKVMKGPNYFKPDISKYIK